MADSVEKVLKSIGLSALVHNFNEAKIGSLELAKQLTDQDLKSLGLTTIGDRVRFKMCTSAELAKQSTNGQEMTSQVSSGRNLTSQIFGRLDRRTQKRKRTKTWTGTFLCLSNKNQTTAPTSEERNVLFRAGLGFKRITCNIDLNTTDFQTFLLTEKVNYPKLKDAGGFEFLRCGQNCRSLQLISCDWTPKEFRTHIGSQAKVFLRPIQNELSLKPVYEDDVTATKEKCLNCGMEVNLRELRHHVENCSGAQDSVESTGSENEQVNAIPDEDENELPDILNERRAHVPDISQERDLEEEWEAMNDTMNDNLSSKHIEQMIHYISRNLTDPVTILKYLQSEIVLRRPLEITDISATIEGKTNMIMVDRYNILETGFDELKRIENFRYTLEVDYYGEGAKDYGGPRKEFFQLILQAIDKMYLENIRDFSVEEYEVVGKVIALSLLQNGRIPVFQEDILKEIFSSDSPRPAILHLRKGLDCLGIYQIGKQVPILLHLFTPRNIRITWRKVITLFEPEFHEPGSNTRKNENLTYKQFVDYVRDVGSGRRDGRSLSDIIKFATGAEEEPVLGFALPPSIMFVESESFLPTANTCINRLNLTRSTATKPLPSQDELFSQYDYAFSNTFYGLE